MQALIGMVDIFQGFEGVQFMLRDTGTELVFKAVTGDVMARLELAKANLDLVSELAAHYAAETEIPFSQMARAGTLALVKAVNSFDESQDIEFADYARQEIVRVMEGMLPRL